MTCSEASLNGNKTQQNCCFTTREPLKSANMRVVDFGRKLEWSAAQMEHFTFHIAGPYAEHYSTIVFLKL